jgi:hypothetical protein
MPGSQGVEGRNGTGPDPLATADIRYGLKWKRFGTRRRGERGGEPDLRVVEGIDGPLSADTAPPRDSSLETSQGDEDQGRSSQQKGPIWDTPLCCVAWLPIGFSDQANR